MKVEEAGKAFLRHCEAERHLSANTISAYRQDLDEFERRFASKDIHGITGHDLVCYAAYLSGPRTLAPATVKRRIACLKSMFHWLLRRSTLAADPFASVEIRVRIPDRLPRCLPSGDMARLAKASEGAPVLTRLATLLLFATGARVSELTSIQLADVDIEHRTIRIVGKGNRERQVFLPNDHVAGLLRRYVETHHAKSAPGNRLLVGRTGRPASPAAIRNRVKQLSREAELKRLATPHVIRHTTATALLEAGVDMRFVQRLLGHRSIATTQIYTHVNDRALKAAVTAADICGRLDGAVMKAPVPQ
jgi:integrase/recombinase XerD